MRALHEIVTRVKMAKIRLIFVEKLANSWLLAAFSASISQIFSHFSLRVLLVQSAHLKCIP